MLAMADEAGIVRAAVPGLSRRAGVSLEEARRAIDILGSPDTESRSPEHEGRRIRVVDGGWLLLNYEKYREIRTNEQVLAARRMRAFRQRHREEPTAVTSNVTAATSSERRRHGDGKQKQKAKAKAKAKSKTPLPAEPAGADDTWLTRYLETYRTLVGEPNAGRIAKALKPVHDEAGAEKTHELWDRWCRSKKTSFGPEWFAANWRKAANGAAPTTTYDSRNNDREMERLK